MNVRVYVYNPVLSDDETITALIVWDAPTPEEAGGVVNNYSVSIQEVGTEENIMINVSIYTSCQIICIIIMMWYVSKMVYPLFYRHPVWVFCLFHTQSTSLPTIIIELRIKFLFIIIVTRVQSNQRPKMHYSTLHVDVHEECKVLWVRVPPEAAHFSSEK